MTLYYSPTLAAYAAMFHYALSLIIIPFQAIFIVMSVIMTIKNRKIPKSAVLLGLLCAVLGWIFNLALISYPNLTIVIFMLTIIAILELNGKAK